MDNRYLRSVVALCMSFHACIYGQVNDSIVKPLHKGETVPDLSVIIHSEEKKDTTRLHDFKGKLLLLDFWAANCLECISNMPDLAKLQDEFGSSIKIILVTQNIQAEIERLFIRFKDYPPAQEWVRAGRHLPFITGDSILHHLFPHKGIPTHVWIDSSSVFKSIAYNSSTKSDNIRAMLAGKEVQLDEIGDIELNKLRPVTWLETTLNNENSIPFYSFIIRHIEYGEGATYFSGRSMDSLSGEVNGISSLNNSIKELYKTAYHLWIPEEPSVPDNRVIIECANPVRFSPPVSDRDFTKCWKEWFDSNTYCYASKSNGLTQQEIYRRMQIDLDNFFRVSSTIEKRNVECMVLKKIGPVGRLSSKTRRPRWNQKKDRLVIEHLPWQQFSNFMTNLVRVKYDSIPYLDESGLSGLIDLSLPLPEELSRTSEPDLQKELMNYGLSLTREFRDIEMLVIRE